MSTANLPRWMQHQAGDLPDPTPDQVSADDKHEQAESDYFTRHGKWSTESGKTLDAINQHYSGMSDEPEGIDWAAFIPFIAALAAWLMWLLFLLMPTAFSFDYAGLFPAVSNWLYVAMGLTLCLAASVAAWFQHGVHAIGFTFAVLLLSYWIF
ncbi:MAG: hypothetical protein R3E93_15930 [Thiothrix sp.]